MDFFDKIINNMIIIVVLILLVYCCYVTLRLDDMWQIIIEQEQKIKNLQILTLKNIGVIS
mgnify:CR=1 FL=1|tara:strand:+ start:96 stop:275 length:180 start_codon:yes stop_codon:yes gene_type:complete